MAQFYSNHNRENDPHALPDCEVFYVGRADVHQGEILCSDPGWYYQYCLPGCLPDSDPIGPFNTEQEAIDAAREEN